MVHTSSDDTQGRQGDSSSEGEQHQRLRLEKVSEVSENTEDDSEKSFLDPALALTSAATLSLTSPLVRGGGRNEAQSTNGGGPVNINSGPTAAATMTTPTASSTSPSTGLSRKDSFHQWSSDEETNIMMSRMRTFFKSMLVRRPSPDEQTAAVRKVPPQLAFFEQELTRLMKTVPGIRDDQVREIVEYLSSEETWSDSYDSSDYTDYTSSDLEGGGGSGSVDFFGGKINAEGGPAGFPEFEDVNLLEDQVSAINRLGEGMNASNTVGGHSDLEGEDFQKETAIMYQKLMNSVVARMQFSNESGHTTGGAAELAASAVAKRSSPPLAAKILHHISSRLVTLMHEVSAGSDNSSTASMSDSRQSLYSGRRPSPIITSSPKSGAEGRRHQHRNHHNLPDTVGDPSSSRQQSGRLQLHKNNSADEDNKEGENSAGYTFASLDSPKVLIGPNLGGVGSGGGGSPQTISNPFRFTKNTSKSVEILDLGRRRASLDDKKLSSIAKSTSTEYDVWQGVHRAMEGTSGRRGSLPRGQLDLAAHSSSSGRRGSHCLGDLHFL